MTPAPDAPYGVVAMASLEMRAGPDHRHELTNQLLLGETVRRLASRDRGRWWHAEGLADGYRGWIRTWGIHPLTAGALTAWRSAARARVRALFATARRSPRGGIVTPLPWSARVAPAGARRGWARVILPAGQSVWVEASALAPEGATPPTLTERVESLWGVPYLWGGRTPAGLDCSGFTQLVLAEQGWAVPRDAHDQWLAARPLRSARQARRGDLVFFSATRSRIQHVGLWLGGGRFAHARGVVRINSLDRSSPLCDKELKDQLRGFGRPVVRAAS